MLEKLLQKRNSGSSLIFVIVAIAFIGILGTIIMQITLINVSMKALDKEAKNSFYSTETGVNELQIALENISSEAMKEAYSEILLKYGQLLNSPSNSIQNQFETSYLEKLGKRLVGVSGSFNMLNETGNYYSVDYLSDLVNNLFQGKDSTGQYNIAIDTKDESSNTNKMVVKLNITNNSGERSILLKDLKITSVGNSKSTNDKTQTVITTDIKLVVPKLSFELTNIYPEFTKYAIIADEQLNAGNNARSMSIDGNVYAGHNGIYVNNSALMDGSYNLKVTGDRIITRGSISVQRGSALKIGDEATGVLPDVWTEQYTTEQHQTLSNPNQKATLSVYANSNVAGDLSLNANYSNVEFSTGYYYGYTFSKENKAIAGMDTNLSTSNLNGSYSSAILLNGNNISLKMENMSKILLAGRSFISREKEAILQNAIDILQGEAVAFKGTQGIYMVPPSMLITGKNPMPKSEYERAMASIAAGTESSLLEFDDTEDEHVKMKEFLYSSEPYQVYWDATGGMGSDQMVYVFYNFKSQEKANEYYKYYFDEHKNELKRKVIANNFISSTGNGITLGTREMYTTANLITAKNDGTLLREDAVEENVDSPAEEKLQRAIDLSKEYKSRQLTLVDGEKTSYGDTSDAYRLDFAAKQENTIFDKIISKNSAGEYKMVAEAISGASHGFVSYAGAKVKAVDVEVGGDKAIAYFVYSGSSSVDVASLIQYAKSKFGCNDTEAARGIIVSSGNINVNSDFTGLIISKKVVEMKLSNCKVKSDEKLVQGLLNTAHASQGIDLTRKFTHYFIAFDDKDVISSNEGITKVDFSDTVSYYNWKKNEED